MKNQRVFLSLVEVAGYYTLLQKGLSEIGIKSKVGFVLKNKFNYEHNLSLTSLRYWLKLLTSLLRIENLIIKCIVALPLAIIMFVYFIISLFSYDIFIFGYGRSFFPGNFDLPILKFFKKKVIFVFHGSDARPSYLDGSLLVDNLDILYKRTLSTKNKIAFLEKYVDIIISQPAISIFNEKPFANWMTIGMPAEVCDVNEISYPSLITILHSPSNLKAKGTTLIREVIKELRDEGFKFKYIEMVNKPNSEVLRNIKECSFVIDQLYSDIFLAGFAAEAAGHGKLSIVGSYEYDELNRVMLGQNLPPTIKISPSKADLKRAITHLLKDKESIKSIGLKNHKFILDNYHYIKVAEKIMKLISDQYPNNWLVSPYDIFFIKGCCIEDQERKELIARYINKFGKESLFLCDKPRLSLNLIKDYKRK